MSRIKTNIVELSELYRQPCKAWLARFKNGRIDAHAAFIEYGQRYEWLYHYSPYDLIGWETENDVFDWENYSCYLIKCCPENFDAEKFNWHVDSWALAKYSPENFDAKRFNWKIFSWTVAKHCPKNIDPLKYNWDKDKWAVERYCPENLKLYYNEYLLKG